MKEIFHIEFFNAINFFNLLKIFRLKVRNLWINKKWKEEVCVNPSRILLYFFIFKYISLHFLMLCIFLGEYIVNTNKCNFLSLKVEKEMKIEEFQVSLKKSRYYAKNLKVWLAWNIKHNNQIEFQNLFQDSFTKYSRRIILWIDLILYHLKKISLWKLMVTITICQTEIYGKLALGFMWKRTSE